MNKRDLVNEWKFIQSEVHKGSKVNTLEKREILFVMQILLNKDEIQNYLKLKKNYLD